MSIFLLSRFIAHIVSFSLVASLLLASAAPALAISPVSGLPVGGNASILVRPITTIVERRSALTASWTIAFGGLKPMHRVVRSGPLVELHLSASTCPASSDVRASSLATIGARTASYVSCATTLGEAVLTLHVAQNQQIRLQPQTDALVVIVEPQMGGRPLMDRHNGTTLSSKFFQSDALLRTRAVLQQNVRQKLELLEKTNRGSSIALNAQGQLSHLPTLPSPVVMGQYPYRLAVHGATIYTMRVDLIARGGVQNDPQLFTRIYSFAYDSKSGVLLASFDRFATDAESTKYGFARNDVHVTLSEGHP